MLKSVSVPALAVVLALALISWATISSRLPGDINQDHRIDHDDLRLLAYNWLSPDCSGPGCMGNLDGTGQVNAVDFALMARNWHADGTTLVISEFMANNGSDVPLQDGELLDEDGEPSDWIEIYNPTVETFSLDGWHLTNRSDNLTQWRFPDGLSLGPGQYMVVFASGKNRAIARSELHTNFSLDVEGEYLALVQSDGNVAHEYAPEYPQQETNLAYGLAQHATLVPAGSTATYHVPDRFTHDDNWTARDFNDSHWNRGPSNIGFGDTSPGLDVTYYEANVDVKNLSTAEAVITNPALQHRVGTVRSDMINFVNTGHNGNFADDAAFPGTEIGTNVNNMVVLVTGYVMVPEIGHWTFGVNSDDGFALKLTRGSSEFSLSYAGPSPRGARDTIGLFYAPEAGFYRLRMVFYEYTGNSALELFAAKGNFTSFNTVYFHLVGDLAAGGLRCSAEANSDVQPLMLGINPSLWTRIEFEASNPDSLNSLTLHMKYDDAFVAYINGVEAARANYASTVAWNSSADDDRPDDLSLQSAGFDISKSIAELAHGRNVLAIQGMNNDKSDTQFVVSPELTATNKQLNPQYFPEPTPWRANTTGMTDEVEAPEFSHERGFHDSSFLLTMATETEDAEIYYTLDGSEPYDTSDHFVPGILYTGPIYVKSTLCIRAKAVKPGWKPSRIVTHTYMMDASAQLKSLPLVSLVGNHGETFYEPHGVMAIVGGTYSGGVWTSSGPSSYNNVIIRGMEVERPVSFEYIKPASTDDLQVDCGLRVHGSNWMRPRYTRRDLSSGPWSGNNKFSFRLYFRGRYGQEWLKYPLFPFEVDRFRSVVLRGGHNDRTNPFIKDELLRRIYADMGNVSSRGNMANLIINGEYAGYYNPCEHIKTGFCQEWFNSDLLWDVQTMNGIRDGNADNWNAMINYARNHNLANNDYYDYLATKLDIPAFADYLILQLWCGNWDWPQNNWSAAAEQSDEGIWQFYIWDAEGGMFSNRLNSVRFGELNSQGNANGWLYRALKVSPRFRQLWGDRIYKHFYNGGALTAENITDRFRPLQDEMRGVIPNMNTYVLDTWVPQRLNIFLNACKSEKMYTFEGPTFRINNQYQQGGHASSGARLSMSASSGQLYYTLDGSNPGGQIEDPGGGETVTLVEPAAAKKAVVPTELIDDAWKGGQSYNDSRWISVTGEPGGVGYERSSGYQSLISEDMLSYMYRENATCYVRIPFTVAANAPDFDSMTLRMRYDDGFVAYLNGVRIAGINAPENPTWNSSATDSHEDSGFESHDVSSFVNLLREGTNVLAIHGLNTSITSSDFLVMAELTAGTSGSSGGGGGGTVEPGTQEYDGPITLNRSTLVKARALSGSTWSALNEAVFAVGPVAENLRINEIMYHPIDPADPNDPNDPNEEYIELVNIGAETINLNLVKFTNGIDFTFGDIELAPGQYTLVVEDVDAFELRYGQGLPIAGRYIGNLANNSERLELVDAVGGVIHNFKYNDNWRKITDTQGYSLTIIDPANPDPNSWDEKDSWRASAYPGGSPGQDDSGILPNPGDIVINEILAHSHDDASDWIELYNTTGASINIGGWYLSDSASNLKKYRIAAGTTIAPYQYMVFHETTHFGSRSVDPGATEAFALSENGETAYLTSAIVGELAGFRESQDFGASSTGISFGRYFKTSTGNYNFAPMSHPTPWQANAYPKVGPIVISEISYHPNWPVTGTYTNDQYEYVEIKNITAVPITLYRYDKSVPWKFTDGIEFTFPDSPDEITIPPGDYLVIARKPEAFLWRYPDASAEKVLGPYQGSLSNSGERVQLSSPGDLDKFGTRKYIREDRVVYSDGSHPQDQPGNVDLWPTYADGYGYTLHRIDDNLYGNDPNNWNASPPSPTK